MMKINTIKNLTKALGVLALGIGISSQAVAGPFILDLTDADDHGGFNGTDNVDGWLYMQRVLENLAPGVTNSNTTVVQLGGTNAAYASSFNESSLAGGGGWSFVTIDGVADLTSFFDGSAAFNIGNAGILQIGSGFHVGGGITSAEIAVLNTFATGIDNFLGGGGGLHSQAEGGAGQYGWLSTLLPGLTFNGSSGSGLTLTGAGTAAFPGLTNADLSAGPYHGRWISGLGGLTTLFTNSTDVAVGIGSAGGSITNPNPNPVPEPATLVLLGLGLAGLGMRQRKLSK
ncbi:MAG: PEP-CTERM sorting domain-containing protein [Pseudomonadales bacterium]|nr:PEP-CTERM sorting domain-containing protein [Pseudomonadales bacterium]